MGYNMVKIYLCDLANDFNGIDNKSIPLGVGFVATYCKKIHKDNVDIKIYRTYKKFIDDVKKSPPDIAGFGSYDWNYNLTLYGKASEPIMIFLLFTGLIVSRLLFRDLITQYRKSIEKNKK